MVEGAPGTGKTFWASVADLRKSGLRVDIVAKTHLSVQNFGEGAVTADHWVRKYIRRGCCPCQVLVCEEMSQLSCYLWNDIAKCQLVGCRFVLLGDFKQFSAICDTWCGIPVPEGALQGSDLLFELSGGHRMELTVNMRSDAVLFDMYTGLWRPGVVFEDALRIARGLFPLKEDPARFTLCISHAERKSVNRTANLRERCQHEATFLRGPESFWIWPGQQLVGAGGACRKGIFYTVASVGEYILLQSGERLTHEAAGKCLRACSALTFASVQGLTLPGCVRLLTRHPHFGKRHLYIGASRATSHLLL